MIFQKYNYIFFILILFLNGCANSYENTNMYQKSNLIEVEESRLIKGAVKVSTSIDEHENTIHDKNINEYPNKILKKLLLNESLFYSKDINFNIKILRNPTINAFALSNGNIYIHTGILAKIENEAQLALLIGHEMSHVIFKHALKRSQNHKNSSIAAQIFGTLSTPFDAGLLSILLFNSSISGYSQAHEHEADNKGIEQIVNAGYNPEEASKLFKIMLDDIKLNEIEQPYFFSTHPRVQERINSTKEIIENDFSKKTGIINKKAYEEYVKPILIENIEIDLKLKRFKSAKKSIDNLLKKYKENAYGNYLLAEYFRLNDSENNFNKSLSNYKLSLEKDSSIFNVYRGLGYLNLKKDKKAEAKIAFEKYLAMNSEANDKEYILSYIKMCKKEKE